MTSAPRFRSIFVRVLIAVVGGAAAAITLSTAIAATLVYDDKRAVIVEDAIGQADAVRGQLEERVAIARAELRSVALAGANGMVDEVPRLVSGNIVALRCVRSGEELVDAAADREAHDALAATPVDGPALELVEGDRLLVRITTANTHVLAVLDVANVLDGPPGWRIELVERERATPGGASAPRTPGGGAVVARMIRDGSGHEAMRAVAHVDDGPGVVVTAPLAPARRAAAVLTQRVLLFSALVLLPVTLLAGFLARAVTRPVRSLAAAVREAKDGLVPLPRLPHDEIGDLGNAIETMARQRFEDAEGLRAAVEFARRAGRMVDTDKILGALETTLREVTPAARWRVLQRAQLATATDLPMAVAEIEARLDRSEVPRDPVSSRGAEDSTEFPLYRQLEPAADGVVIFELYGGHATHAVVLSVGVSATREERIAQLLCGVASSALRHAELGAIASSNEQLAALGRLAAGVTHEINNALALVVTNVEILQEELQGELLDVAADARLGADRVALIVRDLASLSRGGGGIEARPEDLGTIIQTSMKHASARRPEVALDAVPFAPTTVLCDAGRIEQVLINLLGNAADAALAAQRPNVSVSVNLGRTLVSVEIKDRGLGIPAAVVPRLFQPFYTTKGAKGTGLGLFISRTFARAHGGDIRILETSAEGTTIAVTIPLAHHTPSSGPPPPSR